MHKSYLLLGKYQIIVISHLRNETAQMSIVGEIWKRSSRAADHVAGDGSACLQGVARAWAPSAQVPSRSPASAGGTAILRAGASILSLTAASLSLLVVSSIGGSTSGEQAWRFSAQDSAAPAREGSTRAATPPATAEPAWIPATTAKPRDPCRTARNLSAEYLCRLEVQI